MNKLIERFLLLLGAFFLLHRATRKEVIENRTPPADAILERFIREGFILSSIDRNKIYLRARIDMCSDPGPLTNAGVGPVQNTTDVLIVQKGHRSELEAEAFKVIASSSAENPVQIIITTWSCY